MNSSFTSSNSDELIDELSWTSDFATPGIIWSYTGPNTPLDKNLGRYDVALLNLAQSGMLIFNRNFK